MRSGSVLLVLMSVSLVGCADKSPEGVCKKMESLGKAAGKKGHMAQCVMFLGRIKQETPKQYACVADCIHKAGDPVEGGLCFKSCKGSDNSGATAKAGGSPAAAPMKMSRGECQAIAAQIVRMPGIGKYNKTAADVATAKDRYATSCISGRFNAKSRKKFRCYARLARAGQPYSAIIGGPCR
ncbi:MAG: hypothetical protein KC503_14390 [Myxococcales bacterium]|nr:hypothetical protein [Myxococcales bacterium]